MHECATMSCEALPIAVTASPSGLGSAPRIVDAGLEIRVTLSAYVETETLDGSFGGYSHQTAYFRLRCSPGPEGSRDVLVCPWHSFQFDLNTGKEVFWKRPATLRMYPIEEIQSEVLVTV